MKDYEVLREGQWLPVERAMVFSDGRLLAYSIGPLNGIALEGKWRVVPQNDQASASG